MSYRFATAIGKALAAAADAAAAIAALIPGIHSAATKSPPVDSDEFPIADSADSYALKRLTWVSLKSAMKAYYDSVTATMTNKTLTSPVLDGTVTGTAVSSASSAGTLAVRDANKILFANKFIDSAAFVTANGGTTDLSWLSRETQICNGITTHAFRLAATAGVTAGMPHRIINNTASSVVTAKAQDGTTLPGGALAAQTMGEWFPLINDPVTSTDWMKR